MALLLVAVCLQACGGAPPAAADAVLDRAGEDSIGTPPVPQTVASGVDARGDPVLEDIDGELQLYSYHANQPRDYGQHIKWNDGADKQKTYFTPGRWHRVELRVLVNETPGVLDGRVQGWFDGELRLDTSQVMFRLPGGEHLMIGTYFFYTFFNNPAQKNEQLYLDNFVISTEPITH